MYSHVSQSKSLALDEALEKRSQSSRSLNEFQFTFGTSAERYIGYINDETNLRGINKVASRERQADEDSVMDAVAIWWGLR